MFTFIYSAREGTPAASMPDPATRAEKQARFERLLDTANAISAEKHRAYEGKTLRVLVDGETGRGEYKLSARTNGGRLVHLQGEPELIGRFIDVEITSSNTWALYGEKV
jgi:tRNA-2-methylthio-N6-dimethylallyladenosine synthase